MNDTILKQVVKIIAPCIQLFGIYVILYGHISPGGGFAGGTIISASFILQHITFGKAYADSLLNEGRALKLISISLIAYGVLKAYSFFGDYFDLPHTPTGIPGNIFSGGFILPLNILIGIIVTSTIYILYSLFSNE